MKDETPWKWMPIGIQRAVLFEMGHKSVSILPKFALKMALKEELSVPPDCTLTPRIHFGQYTVQLRDQLRTSGVAECCCTCTACSDPANPNRDPISEDELEETANAVAEQDIADFVSGELPIPQRPRPTSRRRTS